MTPDERVKNAWRLLPENNRRTEPPPQVMARELLARVEQDPHIAIEVSLRYGDDTDVIADIKMLCREVSSRPA